MKKVFIIIVLILQPIIVFSQTPKDYIDKFFYQLEHKSFDVAVDSIFTTNKWFSDIKDAQNNIKAQFSSFSSLIGDYYGYEFLTEHKIGSCYYFYTYLVKFERQPFRFYFAFYKAKDKWTLQNFKYDDKFSVDIEDVARMDAIKVQKQNKED